SPSYLSQLKTGARENPSEEVRRKLERVLAAFGYDGERGPEPGQPRRPESVPPDLREGLAIAAAAPEKPSNALYTHKPNAVPPPETLVRATGTIEDAFRYYADLGSEVRPASGLREILSGITFAGTIAGHEFFAMDRDPFLHTFFLNNSSPGRQPVK